MPEEGIQYIKKTELMSYEEIHRGIKLLAQMGIEKVRITGGEPFIRKDMIKLLWAIRKTEGIRDINVTTNGTVLEQYIPELKKLGIRSVNLSLDTLDKARFFEITRRDVFDKVMRSLDLLLENDFDVKINAVVMAGKNEDDIIPLAALTKDFPICVRFIEEMSFNGEVLITQSYNGLIKKYTKKSKTIFQISKNFLILLHQLR